MTERERAEGPPAVRRPNKLVVLLGVTGSMVLLDQLSKNFIRVWLQVGDRVPVLGDVLTLTYLLNPGAAFGVQGGPGRWALWLGLGAAGLLVLVFVFMPVEQRLRLYAVAVTLGGALGNLIDRFQQPAGVVDFIHLRVLRWSFPVFNLADVAVLGGSLTLIVAIWWEERKLRERTT
ncbi:MAG: signal peptidase II [Gemmatimonadota bacterium]